MIPVAPVAMSGMASVHLVAGMMLAFLAVPAWGVFVRLMPVVTHAAILTRLMFLLVDGGFSSTLLLMRSVVCGVMAVVMVAFNHAGFLSVEVIVNCFHTRRTGRYPSSV